MALALAYLAGINLTAFLLFGWDKRCATVGARRIPEKTLLGLAALGGGLGSVLAQQLFRHKTRKQPFANILVAIFATQAVLAIVLLTREG
ncbi:MAG: DUF1294 domain-containing protein [Pseudomonadota bacterium]